MVETASYREAQAALAALKRSERRLHETLGGLCERAAVHAAATKAAQDGLAAATAEYEGAQARAVVGRRERDVLATLDVAARQLEAGPQPPDAVRLELALNPVEAAACKCFFVEAEGPQRAVTDVVTLTAAAARGVLRRHEGSACEVLRTQLAAFCAGWLAGWEQWLGGDGAGTFFTGARALSLQPPGGLACGIDGLEGERAALVCANLMLSVAVRADALSTAMAAAGADEKGAAAALAAAGSESGATGLVARGHERLRTSATDRVGKMMQVAVQLAAHAEAEADAAAAAAALAEAAGAAARAVRCVASVFALLEPAVASADAGIAEPAPAVLTLCRALADRVAAMHGAVEACAAGAEGGGALRRVAASAAALYREVEVGMLVACAQATSGRRLLSRLAEGSEELEQAALGRQ